MLEIKLWALFSSSRAPQRVLHSFWVNSKHCVHMRNVFKVVWTSFSMIFNQNISILVEIQLKIPSPGYHCGHQNPSKSMKNHEISWNPKFINLITHSRNICNGFCVVIISFRYHKNMFLRKNIISMSFTIKLFRYEFVKFHENQALSPVIHQNTLKTNGKSRNLMKFQIL